MNPLKTFFTADQHFGAHHHASKYRDGFDSVDDMDRCFINEWNRWVPEDGHTFILGDFSMSKGEKTSEILSLLNGRKYLVIGNHDKGLNLRNKDYFEWVKPYHEQKMCVDDSVYRLIMSHYPFRSWNKMHYGSWNLHGHCHNNLSRAPCQLDVGVDSAKYLLGLWKPFSLSEVALILRNEQAECLDHHKPPYRQVN